MMRRTILILLLLFPLFITSAYADDAQADLPRRVERLEIQHRESEVITKRLNTLQDLLFDHDRALNDARHVQKRADTQILDRRVQRLEYQQEISNTEQDKKLQRLETAIKDHHDAVVRESDRLRDYASKQLDWLMWGLACMGLIATVGTYLATSIVKRKTAQADTILKEIIDIKSNAENEFNIIRNISQSNNANEDVSKYDEDISKKYLKDQRANLALFSQAIIHTRSKKWDAALILWQDYLQHDPDNAEAWFYVALSAQRLAEISQEAYRLDTLLKQAEQGYERSNALAPNKASVLSNWGNALLMRGKNATGEERQRLWYLAEEKYRQATEVNPEYTNAWYNWGFSLMERGQNTEGEEQQRLWEKAEKKYLKALSIDEKHLNTLFNLACLYALQRDTAECIKWLKKWFAVDPEASVEKISQNNNFNALRDEPEFKAFLALHRNEPPSGKE